jgi:hypothetical protein
MKELKIFDAVEEVMRMDSLQLVATQKFNWRYLRQALAELRAYIASLQTPTPADETIKLKIRNIKPAEFHYVPDQDDPRADEITVWECDRCKSQNTPTAIACAVCGAIRQPKAPAPHGR